MTELRFRAWNGKQMLELQKISFKTGVCLPYGWNIGRKFNNIMQYANRKTPYGDRICEGDIVNSDEGIKGIVKIEDDCFIVHEREGHDFDLSSYSVETILGNIYENSELLEGIK